MREVGKEWGIDERLSEKSARVTPNEWRANAKQKQETPKKVLPVAANGLT
jgi:hypothetical protein